MMLWSSLGNGYALLVVLLSLVVATPVLDTLRHGRWTLGCYAVWRLAKTWDHETQTPDL